MVDTYSTSNRFPKQTVGGNVDSWGGLLNDAMDLVDASMDGYLAFTLSANKTLTTANGATDEARRRILNITGGTGGQITIPAVSKWYQVRNTATGIVSFTLGSGAVAYFPPGTSGTFYCDGTNCRRIDSPSPFTIVDTQASTSGTTITFTSANSVYDFFNELVLQFAGVSHSTAGAMALRLRFISGGNQTTWRTLGSFAGSASIWGALHILGHTNSNSLPSFNGSVMHGALADLTAFDMGASAPVAFPLRFAGSSLSSIEIDASGATFDAGQIRLIGR